MAVAQTAPSVFRLLAPKLRFLLRIHTLMRSGKRRFRTCVPKPSLGTSGGHGRGAIMHMLMGNVAEKVVRTAPCPVLTVRAVEREFIDP